MHLNFFKEFLLKYITKNILTCLKIKVVVWEMKKLKSYLLKRKQYTKVEIFIK